MNVADKISVLRRKIPVLARGKAKAHPYPHTITWIIIIWSKKRFIDIRDM